MEVLRGKTDRLLTAFFNYNRLLTTIVEAVHFSQVHFVDNSVAEGAGCYIHFTVKPKEVLAIAAEQKRFFDDTVGLLGTHSCS